MHMLQHNTTTHLDLKRGLWAGMNTALAKVAQFHLLPMLTCGLLASATYRPSTTPRKESGVRRRAVSHGYLSFRAYMNPPRLPLPEESSQDAHCHWDPPLCH